MWYRVFGRGDALPTPGELIAHLNRQGLSVSGGFDAEQWSCGDLFVEGGSPIRLEHFLATEEGIRAELNSWAAFLETCDYNPQHVKLMEWVVQSKHLVTIRKPVDHADEIRVDRVCDEVCRYLAQATDGFYQVDGAGFLGADGAVLIPEY
jgi:hypothetical protein